MEKKSRGYKRLKYINISTMAAVFIVAMMIAFFAVPKQSYSENENRYLADVPELTVKNVVSGEFTEDVTDYLADHFPMRDIFVGWKTTFEKMTGKSEVNGIYISEDGFYIERYENIKNTKRIVNTLNNLYNGLETADMSIMLVPTAVSVYSELLPENALNGNQMADLYLLKDMLEADVIDVYEKLCTMKQEYQVFYRLDHHWTTFGAFAAYQKYCEKKGFDCPDISEYRINTVTEEFKGTIYSKVNDYTVSGEKISVFEGKSENIKVTYTDTGVTSDTMYAPKYLEVKDKYSFFLDNIHSMIEIENCDIANGRQIMVIKDSYANCFVPFLCEQFEKVYVVDTRYYRDSVIDFINEREEITDVLVLYNMNTIGTDLGISGIY